MFFGFLFFLGDFVAVFPEIHEAADGRDGGGRNFDEVNGVLPGKIQRLGERDDAVLVSVHPDDADFAGTDFAVDPDERGGRGIAWRKRAAQATLSGWDLKFKYCINAVSSG